MKTVSVGDKKSLFSKLIDKLKQTALYDILFSESAGIVINSENTDTMAQVESLAQASQMSTQEVMSIEAEFNKANNHMEQLETTVQSIPEEQPISKNPFAVSKNDLNHDVPKKKSKQISKEQKELDK